MRTRQVAMDLTHQVDPKGEKIQAPLDQALGLGVVLDQTRPLRRRVKKRRQTMSLVTQSKAESPRPSECTVALF
ncbi:hypothetical protein KUCAC02_009441 [Chaenocephalus aceratus]|uniref:Uncharacterized protein n=1 Tax=Chaenocephalus aceratus TaxID=36190 RepID=A0ACB9WUG0_CHAAC|nr:hypothetical protein KUCAC02_009441 [Chaenocephalus aceratus]